MFGPVGEAFQISFRQASIGQSRYSTDHLLHKADERTDFMSLSCSGSSPVARRDNSTNTGYLVTMKTMRDKRPRNAYDFCERCQDERNPDIAEYPGRQLLWKG